MAKVARASRRAEDLRAWCEFLVDSGDWKGAYSAFKEAAESVVAGQSDTPRAEFLDGAALAAQELGRRDLPSHLERAWRATPSMLRLRRWLGSTSSKATLKKRSSKALEACPDRAHRQRALLHVLLGELVAAAELLGAAPGLGWSSAEHPGHVLFPLLQELLGGAPPTTLPLDPYRSGLGEDGFCWMASEGKEPRLTTPEIADLIQRAGVQATVSEPARTTVLKAMREAAEKRVTGVTENKRRRHYGHAAELVAACLTLDQNPETIDWVAKIRGTYRRFAALQREFTARLGPR